MKNVDSAARSRFFKVASWVFPTTGFLGFFVCVFIYDNPKMGLIVGGITGALGSVITHFIIEYLGSSGVNFFYGKHRPIYNDHEKYEGDFYQAQHQKTIKEYQKALVLVNEILKKAPKLPEVLYLKAQILWEGYHKAEDAKANLEKILVLLPDKSETYHTWAQTMLDEINSGETSE